MNPQPYTRFAGPTEEAVPGADIFRDHRVIGLTAGAAAIKPRRGRVEEGKRELRRDVENQHKLIDTLTQEATNKDQRIEELESQVRQQALLDDLCKVKQEQIDRQEKHIEKLSEIHERYHGNLNKMDDGRFDKIIDERFDAIWPKHCAKLEAFYDQEKEQYRASYDVAFEKSKEMLKEAYEQREKDLAKMSLSVIEGQEKEIASLELKKRELEESKSQSLCTNCVLQAAPEADPNSETQGDCNSAKGSQGSAGGKPKQRGKRSGDRCVML